MSPSYDLLDEFNYNWEQYRDWQERYPPWAVGYQEWREYCRSLTGATGDRLLDKLPELSTRTLRDIPGRCPRVFVSHRKDDSVDALRLAKLVQQCGYNYWLDILNPALLAIPGMGLSEQAKAVAMASVIEMGLLNCTHVLALITANTKGTMWIPYEYGRVKEPPPVTLQGACWVRSDYTDSLPEYLLLGPVLHTDDDIRGWLGAVLPGRPAKPPCAPKP
jgi:hypothetical protein